MKNEILEIATTLETANTSIETLEGKQTILTLTNKLNEVIEKLNVLETTNTRDRGPKSQNSMTEDHARRVMIGDLKEQSHKFCAEALGLSYGQVYSARGGYTFKKVYKEMKDLEKK